MSGHSTRSRRQRRVPAILSSSSDENDSEDSVIAGPSRKKRRKLSSSSGEQSEDVSEDSDAIAQRSVRSRERAVFIASDSSEPKMGSPRRVSSNGGGGGGSSDGEGGEKCIICFMALSAAVAKPSNCNHKFHMECLGTWSKTSNTCPIDRVKYTAIHTLDPSGQIISREEVQTPPPQDHNADDLVDGPTVCCEICHQHDREDEMLLCDRCDDGYHLDCLSPPLSRVPPGTWFCPICQDSMEELAIISDEEVRDLLATTELVQSPRPSNLRQQVERVSLRGFNRAAARAALRNIRLQPIASTSRSTPSTTRRVAAATARSSSSTAATTTATRRRQVTQRGRRSRTTRRSLQRSSATTTYRVEFVTVEDGSTIEVKLAVNPPRRRRGGSFRRKSRKKKKRKTARNSSCGKQSSKNPYLASMDDGAGPSCSYSTESGPTTLDLFGSRPQLDYFSGCEAEDELDEDGGGGGGGLGLLVQRATRVFGRSMTSRKQIAARILNSTSRRSRPNINVSTAPVDLVSSIMEEQEKWHNPNSVIHSSSDGRVQVTLKNGANNDVVTRQSAGDDNAVSPQDQASNGSSSGSGNSESRTSGTSTTTSAAMTGSGSLVFDGCGGGSGSGGGSNSVIHPLPPPPIPPSHLVDDEDFDLYADIEAPKANKTDGTSTSCKLAPPPEPPAMLLAMDEEEDREEEAASSPESLVIDDERQVYDPDLPTSLPSPPPPPPKLRDIARIKSDALTATTSAPDVELIVEYPPVHEISLPPASPPGPPHVTAASASASVIEDCPNRSLYSNISRQLAQGKSSDSEDDADDGGHFTPDGEPPPERRTSEPSTAVAAGGDNANGDDTDSEDEAPVKASPNKVPADDKSEEKEDGEAFNDSGTTLNSELNDENHSDFGSLPEDDRVPRSNGVVNGSQETATKSAKRSKISNGDGETEAEIELGCEEDKDGLVDITDDEISNYERRWELEEDNRSQAGGASKTVGLEGLETEAISDCEYNEVEEKIGESSPKESHENGSKEEGEIVVEERPPPVAWKKLSKGTKERSYRDKDTKDKTRKKESKKKEKKKEIERYDVRKLISEKPRRKVDEFGRDLSSKSRSRSRTRSRSPSLKRSLSRGKRKRSVSRPRVGRAASKTRGRLRSKSRGRSRDRSKENKSKRRSRSRSRSRRKSRSRSRKKQRSKSPVPAKKKEKPRERGRPKSKEKRPKRRAKSSASCSSCSCSSCEREKRRSRKLTVTVPNKQTRETAQERAPSKEKRKSRPRYKEGKRSNVGAPLAADGGGGGRGGGSPKRRRLDSPAPSKEVFTSGDNILVSVNFKASKSGEGSRSKDSSKKRRDDDGRKKKDKGTKENQPVRTVSGKGSGRKKLNTKNMKPVAIIDLVNASPFREQTLSPKEVIILTDSDSEEKNKEVEIEIPMLITGPKTPPEPHIKFNLVNSKQQQLRNMSNPLLDSSLEQTEGEGDDEATEIIHKGPNTPPEPPVPYDPFEPTKSRSPTPNPDQTPDRREPSPVAEIDLCPSLTPPQPQPPLTPPKIAQHESPKTPSPLHTPPVSKTTEESGGTGGGSGPIMIMMVDKPKPPPTSLSTSSFIQTTTTTLTVDSEDDSVDMIGGGDSPYSPGSAEGDDLFEPPLPINATTTTTTPKGKPTNTTTSTTTISSSSSVSVPRPIPLANNKHTPLKLTPSPLKKRPSQTKQNSTPIKAGRANSKREIGIKLDEDQLKILDELPNSAVEMQVKDKFLKKLNRQERVVEEVKLVLKPHYAKKHITKEDYKEILRKAVPKICHSKSGEINPAKIQRLIEAYVKKYRHKTKRKTIPPIQTVQSLRNNKQKTMWA